MLTQDGSKPKSVSGSAIKSRKKLSCFSARCLKLSAVSPVNQKRSAMPGRNQIRLEIQNVADRLRMVAAAHLVPVNQVVAKYIGIIWIIEKRIARECDAGSINGGEHSHLAIGVFG